MKKQLQVLLVFAFLIQLNVNAQCSFNTTITPAASATICGTGSATMTAGSGNNWIARANFGGVTRRYAVGFSVGTKGYIGTGTDGTNKDDFWEFDPITNVWTQKANFGGGVRANAVGFSIGTKGYVGLGDGVGGIKNDFWEYNPTLNTWTAKSNFGGGNRRSPVGFSIGTKGYVGTGNNGTAQTNDFWEYNPGTNTWVQKANFGGAARSNAAGFGIGTKGYIGTGADINSSSFNDFWEYDQGTNVWTAKATFAGGGRFSASGFSIGSRGYIAMGTVGLSDLNNVYEYDPVANTWLVKQPVGTPRYAAVAFSIGGKGYMGTGAGVGVYYKDFYEYRPSDASYAWSNSATTQSITVTTGGNYTLILTSVTGCTATASRSVMVQATPTISVNSGSICAGKSFTFTPSGATTYTYSSGSATVSPVITATYNVTGSVNGCASAPKTATVNVIASPTITANNATVCAGSPTVLTAAGGTTYSWTTGATTSTVSVSPTVLSQYTVTGFSAAGCSSKKTVTVSVTNGPVINATASSASVCAGSPATLTATGATSYTWSNGLPATATVVANPTVATIYTVMGSNGGCVSTKTIAVGITTPHAISIYDTHPGGQHCPGFTYTISVIGATNYTWSTGQVGGTIVVSPTVPTSYTATTNPGGCISTNTAASYPYTMLAKPSVSLAISSSVTCVNNNVSLTGSPAGGVYSGPNVVGSNFNSPSVGTFTATYSYTNTTTTCTNSATKTVSVSLCTSLTEAIEVNTGISIYPNPNNGEFTISIPTKGTYSIVNAIGQTVETIDLKDDAQHFNVSGLSQGIYYIIGKTSKAKVIVTK